MQIFSCVAPGMERVPLDFSRSVKKGCSLEVDCGGEWSRNFSKKGILSTPKLSQAAIEMYKGNRSIFIFFIYHTHPP